MCVSLGFDGTLETTCEAEGCDQGVPSRVCALYGCRQYVRSHVRDSGGNYFRPFAMADAATLWTCVPSTAASSHITLTCMIALPNMVIYIW